MTLDLKLLYTRFFQAKDEPPVSAAGTNPYLLDHVLQPLINGEKICYGDLDYSAFEADDLQPCFV